MADRGKFKIPDVPPDGRLELTANEARLIEITLYDFFSSFLQHIPDLSGLYQYIQLLSHFGMFAPEEGHDLITKYLSRSKDVQGGPAEYLTCFLRCGYGPSWRTLRQYFNFSNAMYREVVRKEQSDSPRAIWPVFKDPACVTTAMNILRSLQCFDSLGVCKSGTTNYRRLYPYPDMLHPGQRTGTIRNWSDIDNAIDRADEQIERLDGYVYKRNAGAESEEEKDFWRSRRKRGS